MKKYKSTTTGKVDKLVMFECYNCGNSGEFFESQSPKCEKCEYEFNDDGMKGTAWHCMDNTLFNPKNNGQRWREND